MKTSQNSKQKKKNIIVLENLTIPLYKVSFLRKDPVTGANHCKLNDGSSLTISDEEYIQITKELEKQNETQ